MTIFWNVNTLYPEYWAVSTNIENFHERFKAITRRNETKNTSTSLYCIFEIAVWMHEAAHTFMVSTFEEERKNTETNKKLLKHNEISANQRKKNDLNLNDIEKKTRHEWKFFFYVIFIKKSHRNRSVCKRVPSRRSRFWFICCRINKNMKKKNGNLRQKRSIVIFIAAIEEAERKRTSPLDCECKNKLAKCGIVINNNFFLLTSD